MIFLSNILTVVDCVMSGLYINETKCEKSNKCIQSTIDKTKPVDNTTSKKKKQIKKFYKKGIKLAKGPASRQHLQRYLPTESAQWVCLCYEIYSYVNSRI
jgi:hypothetical protein